MMNLLLDIYLMNANLLKNYPMHGSRKSSRKLSEEPTFGNNFDEYLSLFDFIEYVKVS